MNGSRKAEARGAPRASRAGQPRTRNGIMNGSRQGEARATPKGSREGEAITRPSRAGDKRSRQPESRVRKIWPSFIRMPWDIWVDEVVDGEKGAGADIDVTVLAKHSMNVQRLGIEAAFDLAVAEGEIDGEMQKWVTNKAFGELAAFEFFSNSAREDGSRRFPKGGRSARTAWQKLRAHERGCYRDAVTPTIARELFEQFDARKATPLYKLSKLTRLSEGKYGMNDE